jgi:hypothetical protein
MSHREPAGETKGCIRAGGAVITIEYLILYLKLESSGDMQFLNDLVRRKVAVALAEKRSLTASDEDVENALIELYTDRDLFEEDQVRDWLASRLIDEATIREYAADTVLIQLAKASLVSDEAVAERFGLEHHAFSRAMIERYEFSTIGRAREFILAVRESEHSPAGGALIQLASREAPEEIAAELIAIEPGDLIGPIETDDEMFHVYLLRERNDAELDDDLVEEIRNAMFTELIDAALVREPLKFLK